MMETIPLVSGVTTREVNRVFRSSIDRAIDLFNLPEVERDERLDRYRPFVDGARSSTVERRYVHGIHTSLRDTLVGHHIPGSGEMVLAFPNDYRGWDAPSTTAYDRLRVRIWDLIMYHHDIRLLVPEHDVKSIR